MPDLTQSQGIGAYVRGRILMRRLLLILVPLAVAAPAAASPGAAASTSSSPVAILEDCRERAVLVPGVEKLVRRRVPAQFELVRDPLGRPLLAVVGSRCKRYSITGLIKPKPTTFTFFVAVIESPDGEGCLSRWPLLGDVKPDLLPLCNFYNFFAAYNNRALAKTYRETFRALGVNFPVYYVRNLVFREGAFDPASLGAPWHFRAGGRTPSPFELDAIVREGPLAGPGTISFWSPGPSGLVGGRFEVDDFTPGQMDVTLHAAPGSGMAELFGTAMPTPIAGLANHYHHAEGRLINRVSG